MSHSAAQTDELSRADLQYFVRAGLMQQATRICFYLCSNWCPFRRSCAWRSLSAHVWQDGGMSDRTTTTLKRTRKGAGLGVLCCMSFSKSSRISRSTTFVSLSIRTPLPAMHSSCPVLPRADSAAGCHAQRAPLLPVVYLRGGATGNLCLQLQPCSRATKSPTSFTDTSHRSLSQRCGCYSLTAT
jgi:hypothetical protein